MTDHLNGHQHQVGGLYGFGGIAYEYSGKLEQPNVNDTSENIYG